MVRIHFLDIHVVGDRKGGEVRDADSVQRPGSRCVKLTVAVGMMLSGVGKWCGCAGMPFWGVSYCRPPSRVEGRRRSVTSQMADGNKDRQRWNFPHPHIGCRTSVYSN